MNSELIKVFSKNRAEEFPIDVWGEYVIPPNYETINLFNFNKAVMIEGGRGSGKTMFLKYHCHDTRFSKKRKNIEIKELEKIGIYFRPDTHFCSSITKDIYGNDWEKIFSKYLLISILKEIYRFLRNLASCDLNFELKNKSKLLDLTLPIDFNKRMRVNIKTITELDTILDQKLAALNDWVSDPDFFERPIFPDARNVITSIIKRIKKFDEALSKCTFIVYIDEYENLTEEQQKILNTWIKHGTGELIFSAAYKKHANVSRETLSNERIVHRNDYRKIDIEDFSDDEFKFFSAEILLLKLHDHIKDEKLSRYKEWLCDEKLVTYRRDNEYKSIVLNLAKKFLPSISYDDVAREIIKDNTLKNRLINFLIKPSLTKTKLTPDEFIDERFHSESIINGVLLNRPSHTPQKIIREFNKLKQTGDSTFYQQYRNILVGAILWIYISAGRRTIPIYSGFDRICLMSKSNMRHFLEFCHQCLVEHKKTSDTDESEISIPVATQALAARKNSELEVEKVVELGRWGNNLRFIVNRLGLFFQLLQKRKSQSEPEIVHFGIEVASIEQLPKDIKLLLSELKIWSVLIEYHGDTKRKSHLDFTSHEYMLHPIFSPNFSISFRKIRKHIFSASDIETIFCGSESDFISFCKPYITKSNDDSSYDSAKDIQGTLFDDFH
ncbi:ORC-CDC6 family AAA ATPase [Zobellella denitrificans]